MADGWKPFLFALAIAFVFGSFLPAIIAPFVAPTSNDGTLIYQNGIQSFVEQGGAVNLGIIGKIAINIISLFGGGFQQYLLQSLYVWNILPTILSIPIILIITVCLIYGAVKLFLP